MTTTEAIFAAWLFVLTLAVIGLFAAWLDQRSIVKMLTRDMLSMLEWRDSRTVKLAQRSDAPVRLVGADRGKDDGGGTAA
jgi:hypothetical protein